MFIDEKGKIFGKISVIDLALIVLIIAACAFIGVKFFGNNSTGSKSIECSYVVKIKNIRESSVKHLKVGDTLYNDDNAYMGVIEKDPQYTKATDTEVKNDGSFAVSEIPEKVDVLLTIKGSGLKNTNGFYLDGKVALLIGTERFFKGDDIDFTATVVEVLN